MVEEKLMDAITEISKKYDLLNKNTGGYFNIFEIANIEHDEVVICRVLCELLSPNGTHNQGHTYLKLFLENILNINLSDKELKSTKVLREVSTAQKRRIDLVIETANHYMAIEVKIYAGDQTIQCKDYYEHAKNSNKEPIMCYLTRFGDSPSGSSAKGLTKSGDGYQEVKNISFENHILDWLDACLKQRCTLTIAPIREIILQFITTIRNFTGKMEDGKEMEIADLITSSKSSMQSAVAIEKAIKQVREKRLLKLFQAIEAKVGHEKLVNKYDYVDKCKDGNPTCPGISFEYMKNVKEGVDIWVRVEVKNKLFIGYCTPYNGVWNGRMFGNNEICEILNTSTNVKSTANDWWAKWEYLPSSTSVPDFKNPNEAYYNLYDEDNFNEVVNICCAKINEYIIKEKCIERGMNNE